MKQTKFNFPPMMRRIAIFIFIAGFLPLLARGEAESISLSQALETALGENPSIKASTHQREAARARVWEAKSGFLPQLSVTGGYSKYQEPNIIIPIHQIGVFPPLDDQIYETSVQMRMPLFTGGRVSANARAAKASLHESAAQEELVRLALLEGVGQVFIQARQLEDNRQLVAARIQSLERRYREMSLLLKEGRISPADLALVNASIESSRSDSIDIESKKMELAFRLSQLLGVEHPVYPAPEKRAAGSPAEEQSSLSVSDTIVITSPLVLKAQAQFQRAKAGKKAANSAFFPEISAFAVYNYRSGADLDLIGEWVAGVTIRIPLFEGGRRLAGKRAARASLQAAEASVKSARQEQSTRLRIAASQWQSARNRREYLNRAVQSKATSVAAQQEMYKAGRISLSEVLVQETELLQLQIQERALSYTEILAILNYYAVAGTLTPSKVQEIVRSIP